MKNKLKKQLLFSFILIISYSISSFGQDLSKLDYDQLKELYLKSEGNQKLQEKIAFAFIKTARKNKDNLQIGRGYNFLASCSEKSGNEKIKFLDSIIKYTKENKNKDFQYPERGYVQKAYELRLKFKFKEAIDNLLLAERYCKEKNSDFIYWVYFHIAIIKSEDLGEINESLQINRKAFNFIKKEENLEKNKTLFGYLLFSLADNFKTLKNTDSCTFYNRKGFEYSLKNKDTIYKNLFILNEGANLITQKKYKVAIDSINKVLPYIKNYGDYGNTIAGYYYLGKAYEGLNNTKKAVENYIRVDSIYSKTKDISFEFYEGYNYLINYYKTNGDSKNQLLYATKKIAIDSILYTNYKELSQKLKNEYDTPNLVREKEQETNLAYNVVYLLLAIFMPVIIFIAYKKHKLKKGYEAKIDALVNAYNNNNINTIHPVESTDTDDLENETVTVKKININPDTFKEIEQGLEKFEKQKLFLDPSINASALAIKLNTNYKYITEVIRIKKDKLVTQYINDLRIEEGLRKIQKDNKILVYNNDAIALEFGFNNYKTFKKAFLNSTQVEFRDFIEKIKNSHNQ